MIPLKKTNAEDTYTHIHLYLYICTYTFVSIEKSLKYSYETLTVVSRVINI